MNNKKMAREVIIEKLDENPQEVCLAYIMRKHFPNGLDIKIDDMVNAMIDGVDNGNDLRELNAKITDEEVKFYFEESKLNIVNKFIEDMINEVLKNI